MATSGTMCSVGRSAAIVQLSLLNGPAYYDEEMKICDKYLVFQIHPDSFIPPHCHNIIAIDIVSSILTDDPTSI